jgi:hypothetical protein
VFARFSAAAFGKISQRRHRNKNGRCLGEHEILLKEFHLDDSMCILKDAADGASMALPICGLSNLCSKHSKEDETRVGIV